MLLLGLLLVHAWVSAAEHQERRVVVLGSERERTIVANLRAELATYGLTLIEQTQPPTGVEDAWHSRGVVAVVRMMPDERSAEIQFGSPQMATVIVEPVDASEPDLSATRIAEALRVRLTRLHLTPPPLRRGGTLHSRPARRAPQRPAAVRRDGPLWLSVGPAATLSPGASAGAILHGGLEVTHDVGPRLALGVQGLAPLAGGGLTSQEGRATLRPWLIGPMADLRLWSSGQWSLWSGAGAALVLITMHGEAEQPYVGVADTVICAAGIGRIYGLWHLAPSWHFRVGLAAGMATPRPVVQFAGHRISAWGTPFTLVSMGIAVAP